MVCGWRKEGNSNDILFIVRVQRFYTLKEIIRRTRKVAGKCLHAHVPLSLFGKAFSSEAVELFFRTIQNPMLYLIKVVEIKCTM